VNCRIILAGVVALCLTATGSGDQPKDPFANAPAGQISTQQTQRGFLVICNLPDDRCTYELVGQKVGRINYEDKGTPLTRLWDVDGMALQSTPVPLKLDGNSGYAEEVLMWHQKYETDYQAKQGYKEIASARRWLQIPPTGQPGLYWELAAPANAQGGRKMLLANALNGRVVVYFTITVLPNVDEAKAKKVLIDTVKSLRCYEKDVTRSVVPESATAMVVNDEIGTREDRKAAGAIVVKPEASVLLARMALELYPGPAGYMTGIHDGKSGHMITLARYDAGRRRFLYHDTLGNRSFLQKDNNRAGVDAQTEQEKRLFSVTEPELQSVLEGVIMVPFGALRPYFRGNDLKSAVQEYRLIHTMDPKAMETSEAFLLKAAGILANEKEFERASNIFGVCRGLHEKSTRAYAGIGEVFVKMGRSQAAVEYYTGAIKGLPDDPSLDEAKRNLLAATWQTTLVKVRAQPAPAAKP
jgi:tetratricopeptide (TPR) repeat protein